MLAKFRSLMVAHMKSEEGATAVEYGLIVALIAAVIATIVATLGTQVAAAFQGMIGSFSPDIPDRADSPSCR